MCELLFPKSRNKKETNSSNRNKQINKIKTKMELFEQVYSDP